MDTRDSTSDINKTPVVLPERRAWYILLGAFVVFLFLLGLLIYGIQYYIFQSERDLALNLAVASGSVIISEPGGNEAVAIEDNRESLQPALSMTTGANSQALLTFHPQENDLSLLEIRMYRETNLLIEEASLPRFRTNEQAMRIRANFLGGNCDIHVPTTGDYPVDISIVTSYGVVKITSPGDYRVNVSESALSLESLDGTAIFTQAESQEQIDVSEGILHYDPEADDIHFLRPDSLITNGEFDVPADIGWEIYNDELTDPQGIVTSIVEGNRSLIIFDRSQSNWPDILLGHGETGITQTINRNVTESAELVVRIRFLIEEQSLPLCGERGSECPLMLRILYRDELGEDREYITGLYANTSSTSQYPNTCDSCRSEHTRIRMNSWYIYDSENILTRLPEELRPDFIKSLTVFASGHAYRVIVDEIVFLSIET